MHVTYVSVSVYFTSEGHVIEPLLQCVTVVGIVFWQLNKTEVCTFGEACTVYEICANRSFEKWLSSNIWEQQ